MWDEKSIKPKIETGSAFTPHMNYETVNKILNQTSTQRSVVLIFNHYNPLDFIIQHLPNKEKVQKSMILIECEMDILLTF